MNVQKCFENFKDPSTNASAYFCFPNCSEKFFFKKKPRPTTGIRAGLDAFIHVNLWALLHYFIMNVFLIDCLNDLIIVWLYASAGLLVRIF